MSNSELSRIGERLEILSRAGQKLGRIIDQEPRNSKRWAQAVKEARAIASECVRLAHATGNPDLIREAEFTSTMLPVYYGRA